MYAILDGKTDNNSPYTFNLAYFYERGNPNALFTYRLTNPRGANIWGFNIAQWNTPQSNIPLDMYPTLSFISYDYSTGVVDGNCTVPMTSQPNDSPVAYVHCMRGSFNAGKQLSLDLTVSIGLNNTSAGTTLPSISSLLHTQDQRWYFDGEAPALILRQVDPTTNELQREVLRTTVKKVGDCTELKVCLLGTGRAGGLVGAEVLAPLGLVLKRQGDYSVKCADDDD